MIRRLIILLLIVGCEDSSSNGSSSNVDRISGGFCIIFCDDVVTVPPGPSLCGELTEVELWGVDYDIETTTILSLNNQELTGSIQR